MQTLCIELLHCNCEQDVENVLNNNTYSKESSNWKPLGGSSNNASVVQNTAGTIGACLTEMTTNCFDALIQREKNIYELVYGEIDAEVLKTPQSAFDFLYQNNYPQASNLQQKEDNFKEYSKANLNIYSTEYKGNLRSVTFMDRGCGQKASNFQNTFCSIASGNENKANKPWLHGNYGQGSTSANAVSGMKGYKLIISREDPQDNWGWTIIRRNPEKLSMLEYLTINGEIPNFFYDKIQAAFHCHGAVSNKVDGVSYGSIIKLYNVDTGKGFTVVKELLNPVLVKPLVPPYSVEFTYVKEKSDPTAMDPRWIYGLENELNKLVQDHKAVMEPFKMEIGEVGTAYGKLFFVQPSFDKKSFDGWQGHVLSDKSKRFFTLNNGQTQHIESQSVIGKYYTNLKDRLFVIMDLSHINPEIAKAYFWKADRTSFQMGTTPYLNYRKMLDQFIDTNVQMKQWEIACKNDYMSKAATDAIKGDGGISDYIFSLMHSQSNSRYQRSKNILNSEGVTNILQGKRKACEAAINDFDFEVQGDIERQNITPNFLEKINATKDKPQKSVAKNLHTKRKTNMAPDFIGKADSKGDFEVSEAKVVRNGVEENLDLNGINHVVSLSKDGTLSMNFALSEEMVEKVKPGEQVVIKVALTDKTNQSLVLEYVLFFEIIPVLENTGKLRKVNKDNNMFMFSFGTLDGREYAGNPTNDLSKFPNNITQESLWFMYHHMDKDKLVVIINLDNIEFKSQLDHYTKNEDKKVFIQSWKDSLALTVMTSYKSWAEKNVNCRIDEFIETYNEREKGIEISHLVSAYIRMNMHKQEELLKSYQKMKVA